MVTFLRKKIHFMQNILRKHNAFKNMPNCKIFGRKEFLK